MLHKAQAESWEWGQKEIWPLEENFAGEHCAY